MPRLNLSSLVILAVATIIGLWFVVTFAHASPLIVGVGLLIDAAIAGALFHIDWSRYWATLPSRAHGAAGQVGKRILEVLACGAIGAAMIWTVDHSNSAGFVVLFLITGYTMAAAAVVLFLEMIVTAITALLVNPEPNGRQLVEGQDIHGSAGFANASAVDAALKGVNPPSPVRASVRPSIGYRYED